MSIKIQSIIEKCVIDGIFDENDKDYRVSYHMLTNHNKRFDDSAHSDYFIINIDGVDIKFYAYKDSYKKGYYGYFYYDVGDCHYSFYLTVDLVLDNKKFYTNKKADRRLPKLKELFPNLK